ncbi:hypothetical protein CXB51_014566 [Gossypium anomalum]|uniref:Reverse transcriptase Ty1/copia-type domain-containing protein n=1 Tax=Gossypium anomalum TaxID=47600 RepID=A0A8J5ZLG3_9ROSI|nr:hypothetical protein CXB51_014566 [Gossypium anomalum]
MVSLKYEIPLLDRNTRFVLWQIKMQAVLTQMDLEDALLGIDKMSLTLTEEENKRKDRKALTQLYLHLSNKILQDVMKEKTAAELWKRLEQICMSKTLTSKLHMKQCLYAHRLEEGASVHKHFTVFKEILSNLEAMEVQYDKEDLGLIPLCSLPPSYSTFKDTILYSRDSFTVDEVYDSLTSYDKMKHLVVKPDSEEEGLIVRGRQDRNADDNRGRTQERNPRGKAKGRLKSSNKEDYNNGELLVTSINNSKVRAEWILDSGCTFHMSPNRDWFTTYETVSEEGYKCTAESGVLKLFKGSLVGSTVTGDAAVASSSLSDDDNRVVSSPQYSIAKNRTIREIKPPKTYVEADLVAYALNVAEDIDANQESSNYSEADYVCLLKKSLYSLKQSPRQWYKRFDSFITSHDFKRSSFDNCVYFEKKSDGFFVYLLLYVDDILIAAKDKGEIKKIKAQLSEEFEMKYLGSTRKILGMEFIRGRKLSKLYLSQRGYIEKVLCRFNMQSAKLVKTPLTAHFRLSSALSPQSDDEIECMLHVPYSSTVGSLMYAMVCSRLDLSYAVSAFGRTRDGVIGYVDADFAGDLDRRGSITAALSTTEAEYMTITEACKEAIWLKRLFSELNEELQINKVFCDNQSDIFFTKDQMFYERTKHSDIRYHFVRDIIARGDIVTWLVFIVEVKPLRDFIEEVENLFVESSR